MKGPKKAIRLSRQAILHPVVKFLKDNIPPGRISDVSDRAGVDRKTMGGWFDATHVPGIFLLDHALHAIGYRLAVVPLNSSVPVVPPLPPLPGIKNDENKD